MALADVLKHETDLDMSGDGTDLPQFFISIGTEFLYNQKLLSEKYLAKPVDGAKYMKEEFSRRLAARRPGVLSREFAPQNDPGISQCYYANITILVSWRDRRYTHHAVPIVFEAWSNSLQRVMSDVIILRETELLERVAEVMPPTLSTRCTSRIAHYLNTLFFGELLNKARPRERTKLH